MYCSSPFCESLVHTVLPVRFVLCDFFFLIVNWDPVSSFVFFLFLFLCQGK